MASTLYNIARQGFLTDVTVNGFSGKLDWKNDNIYGVLVTPSHADPIDGYTFDPTHSHMDDVGITALVGTPELISCDADNEGWALADNITFPNVVGNIVGAVILYRAHGDGSVPENNVLVGYIEDVVSGLPITPNGGDISILWNAGLNKRLFRL